MCSYRKFFTLAIFAKEISCTKYSPLRFSVGAFLVKNAWLPQWLVFLVGAFLVKRVRLLQWLVFFSFFIRPQTSSCMYHFLVQHLLGSRWTQRSQVRVFASARNLFDHLRKRTRLKGPLFQFFSALWTFFYFFVLSSKGPTFKFFLIICSKVKCQKAQRVSPFKYFGTVRLFKTFIFVLLFENLFKIFEFFFVSEGSPLQFFWYFKKLDFQNAERVPFYSFKNFALFEP